MASIKWPVHIQENRIELYKNVRVAFYDKVLFVIFALKNLIPNVEIMNSLPKNENYLKVYSLSGQPRCKLVYFFF